MQVILKKRIPKIGNEHDVINVKPGYARNFLFPNALAVPATDAALKQTEKARSERVEKAKEATHQAKEIAEKLKNGEISFVEKAKENKLYGSIKEADIIEAVKKEYKIELEKGMIKMESHIKDLGEHIVKIEINDNYKVDLTVKVEAE